MEMEERCSVSDVTCLVRLEAAGAVVASVAVFSQHLSEPVFVRTAGSPPWWTES